MRTIWLYVVLSLFVSGCGATSIPYQTEGGDGRVGQHMTVSIVLNAEEAGCGNKASGQAILEGGSLPPGISQNGWYFEGTPTEPGKWRADFRLVDLVCAGPRPDQKLTIDFDVKP